MVLAFNQHHHQEENDDVRQKFRRQRNNGLLRELRPAFVAIELMFRHAPDQKKQKTRAEKHHQRDLHDIPAIPKRKRG
jgi:hypothetical protein